MYESNEAILKKATLGNDWALEKMIETNSGLIWSIAKRFIGRGYELEDLYQIGCIGMIKSIRKFNFEFGVKFSTYAVPYILGEIKKFIRDDGMIKISRATKELGMKIKEIEKKYLIKTGESISVKNLSEILKVSEEEIVSAIEALRQVESINEEIYENGKCTKLDKIMINKDEQGKIIDRITLNEMINKLKERDKKVIVLRFYREKTQTQVAEILGISQVQVSRIERRILKELKEKLLKETVL